MLHDMFDVPFDQIALLVGRSPTAVRQLASRARRRVRAEATPDPGIDPTRQRGLVNAFFAAARSGDFDGLVAVLHPDIVLRGAAAVAKQALTYGRLSWPASAIRPALDFR